LLSSLDNGYLWQDEAETALLARNTLAFGYPRVFDGRNLIDASPYTYGPGMSWIYSPWLPFYLLAGVFAAMGESTAAARLPFALLGWLTLVLAWRLARRLTTDVRIHRLTVALLTCSVPFLLHMRQCRYYAMAAALLLAACLAYLRFLERPSGKRVWVLAGTLVLLFHTNFGTWIPAVSTIVAHQLIWGEQAGPSTSLGTSRRRLILAGLGVLALTLPWALFAYQPAFIGSGSLDRMVDHLAFYVRTTNKYLAPLAFMIGMSLVAAAVSKHLPPRGAWRIRVSPPSGFLVLMALAQLAFLLIPDQRQIRYFIPTVPLLALGQAWWLAQWWRQSRLIGGFFIPLFLFTNVHQSTSPGLPLADFAYELTHRYVGPVEGIVACLRARGRREESVKIPYDDRSLMFYTTLRIEPRSDFLRQTEPDWLIPRRGWTPARFLRSAYFRRIEAAYERIELDAPDIYWQNREDPGLHHFRTAAWAPRVVVYRKRSSAIAHEPFARDANAPGG
ncbi:MAG: glycosyltransferase family 39 protein, partial [Candidatus Omnitrophica bacterium]|nr:glycosyltransferase family 39 protein [Candidatus Omnitrophota bacterium]